MLTDIREYINRDSSSSSSSGNNMNQSSRTSKIDTSSSYANSNHTTTTPSNSNRKTISEYKFTIKNNDILSTSPSTSENENFNLTDDILNDRYNENTNSVRNSSNDYFNQSDDSILTNDSGYTHQNESGYTSSTSNEYNLNDSGYTPNNINNVKSDLFNIVYDRNNRCNKIIRTNVTYNKNLNGTIEECIITTIYKVNQVSQFKNVNLLDNLYIDLKILCIISTNRFDIDLRQVNKNVTLYKLKVFIVEELNKLGYIEKGDSKIDKFILQIGIKPCDLNKKLLCIIPKLENNSFLLIMKS